MILKLSKCGRRVDKLSNNQDREIKKSKQIWVHVGIVEGA